MNLSDLPLFQAIGQKLAWLGERQNVLAQNIANADTPGYTPRDLKDLSFADMLGRAAGPMTMASTAAGHLGGVRPASGNFTVIEAASAETNTVGNAVVLEDELMKVAKTASDHQLLTNLYRKHIDLLKLALGRGSSG
ncbi:MAG: flagellar basal body rod protein FlgB [Alphaproteobacteria bacterium]